MKQGTSLALLSLVTLLRVAHICTCMGWKGSSSRPLSLNSVLTASRPPSLVRLRRLSASFSSEPYTCPRSRKAVRALICSLLLGSPPKLYAEYPVPQAGADLKAGMQLSGREGRRGSPGGICLQTDRWRMRQLGRVETTFYTSEF